MNLGEGAKILITGARGFVGGHLVSALRQRFPAAAIELFGGQEREGDIRDRAAVCAEVRRVRPSHIAHLAGVSAVAVASEDPDLAWEVNLRGTLNLLEAVRTQAPDAGLLHVSTGEVYGLSFEEGPATEGTLLRPANVYAASKAAADLAVQQKAVEGLNVVIARPFNHIGRGQSAAFVVPAFASQIAAIEEGRQEAVLKVGSLEEERDFLTVGDVVQAYVLMLDQLYSIPSGLVFNVASGRPRKISDVLDQLLSLTPAVVRIETDPDRLRQTAMNRVCGDATRLRTVFGWSERETFEEALKDVLDEQRQLATSAAMRARY